MKENKDIVFNGNGYTDEWVAEAEKRGLWQAADETIDQLQALYLDIEGELEESQDDT